MKKTLSLLLLVFIVGTTFAQDRPREKRGDQDRKERREDFRKAYKADKNLPNLLLDSSLASTLNTQQKAIREVVKIGIDKGIPMSVYNTTLAYFDAYRSEVLPTNLIQAQRDYFGAHTYERIDQEGIFHTEWDEK